ncbi:tripartite tricarboxylate transporter substrate binding protein [Sporosarcina sp. P3]|uniref:Bug family tripartite tricarboxylate transporter substrate binding protein n=1 Tax=Sporosarcina sp. P3 TaxID=2048245 RepID=UPI0013043E18|nr:tripartite tricarboxylate transporter substrate binding protein [Sporosarcina sp. P3]
MKKFVYIFVAALFVMMAGCSNKQAQPESGSTKAAAETIDQSSSYPEKPIELIVPFAPGGSTDVMARMIAKELPNYLPHKQQVAVINKPGAGTTLGLTEVATAKPDGYTIAITTSSGLDIQPHYGKTSYSIEDFKPIAKAYEITTAISVKDDSPLKTYDDWLAFVKENPNQFTYGASGGTGSGGHISMEKISKELDVKTKHVPFEGVADVKNAIISGQIMGGLLSPDTETGGDIRPLVFDTASKGSTDFYKDIPTTTEVGLSSVASYYVGFLAPKDTPEEIVSILHDAIKEILEKPETQEIMVNQQLTSAYADSEEFANVIENASKGNEEMMKVLGLIK